MNISSIIKNAEAVDLSGEQVNKIAEGKARILSYSELERHDTLDSAFGGKNAMILLYEIRSGSGHWVAVIKHPNNIIEFMDSYGLKLDTELQYTHFYFNEHGVPHLTRLIQESGMELIENTIRLQQFKEHVNTCGRFASFRVRLMNKSLKEFQAMFLNNKQYSPDELISILTLWI